MSTAAHARAGAFGNYSDALLFLFETHTYVSSFLHKLITENILQLKASSEEAEGWGWGPRDFNAHFTKSPDWHAYTVFFCSAE